MEDEIPEGWRGVRVRFDADVMVNHTVRASALDLSEFGMYLFTRSTPLPQSLVELRFVLENKNIVLTARVEHTQEGVGFGVCFVDVPSDTLKMIRDYVVRTMRSGGKLPASGPRNA